MTTKNQVIYTLIIYIDSYEEPFKYIVPESEYKRLSDFFSRVNNTDNENTYNNFIGFETSSNTYVVLSVNNIQLVQFLFDVMRKKPKLTSIDDGLIALYFRGRKEPITAAIDEPIQVAHFINFLEDNEMQEDAEDFFILNDVDGEDLAIAKNQISLLEIDSKLINDGNDELFKDSKKKK